MTSNLLDDLQTNTTEVLSEIATHTHSVVDNTTRDFFHDDVSFVASLSLLATIAGFWFVWREYNNEKIDKECQQHIFTDILRHFYRNKICTITMMFKYNEAVATTPLRLCYPSDEHYLKLMVLPDDLHLEKFYKDKKRFDLLHNLHLLMRNYNVEVKTSLSHIKQFDIDRETKDRDFNTLSFKCGLITLKIIETMDVLWAKIKPSEILWEQIVNAHAENVRKNPRPEDSEKIKRVEAIVDAYLAKSITNGDNYFALFKDELKRDKFIEIFREDLVIELLNDSKIHIINVI